MKNSCRKLTDHSNIFAPINCLFYSFSKVPNNPYIKAEDFPQLQALLKVAVRPVCLIDLSDFFLRFTKIY